MGSNSKISTTSRVTINRLSLKKISFIKLLTAFFASIPEEKAYTMSWNNQIFAKESRNLVSRIETTFKSAQRLQVSIDQLSYPSNW